MHAFLKSKYHATVIEMQNGIQYASIRMLGTSGIPVCDTQSACAKAAREIADLIERKQNSTYQNSRVKEEIMVLLDHEKLLTRFGCNALALITLQEVARILIIRLSDASSSSERLLFLQEIQVELRQKYSDKLTSVSSSSSSECGDAPTCCLEVLVPKHLGQGMKYLEALRKHTNNNSNNHNHEHHHHHHHAPNFHSARRHPAA